MSDIRAWEVSLPEEKGSRPFAVFSEAEAQHYRETPQGCTAFTVTPLVAAPPEGAPTYGDLAEALKDFLGSDEMGLLTRSHVRSHARALLSRLPKEG